MAPREGSLLLDVTFRTRTNLQITSLGSQLLRWWGLEAGRTWPQLVFERVLWDFTFPPSFKAVAHFTRGDVEVDAGKGRERQQKQLPWDGNGTALPTLGPPE